MLENIIQAQNIAHRLMRSSTFDLVWPFEIWMDSVSALFECFVCTFCLLLLCDFCVTSVRFMIELNEICGPLEHKFIYSRKRSVKVSTSLVQQVWWSFGHK